LPEHHHHEEESKAQVKIMTHILGLDIAGNPWAWLSPEDAVCYYAKGKVAWELGDDAVLFRGGMSNAGVRSIIGVKPIIAVFGSDIMASMQADVLPLGDRNELLFKRDRCICGYCAGRFPKGDLTRDHIIPRSRGGANTWENCCSCCLRCNQEKRNRTPAEWGRELVYVPYAPSRWEHFILNARTGILADQMDYLAAKLPKHSRVRN
jgi:hypothetical protein